MWDKGEIMKKFLLLPGHGSLFIAGTLFALFLVACGDDDDFSPVAKNRGYDYAYTTAKGLSETPCNEMREGREAVIGRDKDRYECRFDRADSVYIWVGYDDTLTAEGREFHRAESSSSLLYSSSSFDFDITWSYDKDDFKLVSIPFTLTSKDELFNPEIEYGTMTDERDGQVYRTVVIGNRVWMAENLNFAGNDDYPLVLERSACINFDDDNCALLGRLYSREATMDNIACKLGSSCDIGDTLVRGVCPKGWHIPSSDEATALVDAFGDKFEEVRSAKTWSFYNEGGNTTGFSMPATGGLNFYNKDFDNLGRTGIVWAYIKGPYLSYLVFRGESGNDIIIHSGFSYNLFASVRCVSDDTLNVVSLSSSVRSSSSVSSSSISSSSSGVSSSSFSSSSFSIFPTSSSSERYSKMDVEPYLKEKGEQFNPDIEYGTMRDSRDGQVYKTVVVNGQTWMAENLNYARHKGGESFCFNMDTAYCELYGRLYARDVAMDTSVCYYKFPCELGSKPVQGVCPSGWHIPSYNEALSLAYFVEGKSSALRSAKGWKPTVPSGTDIYGLSFVGTGALWPNNGTSFKSMGTAGYIWVYEPSTNSSYLSLNGESVSVSGFTTFPVHLPVRCIADKAPASSSSAKSSSSSVSSSSVKSSSSVSSSSFSSSSVSSSSAKSSSSESSSSEESSSSFDKTVLFNSAVSYGEMTDGRDGKTYRTLYIAGHTWMAENLNFADSSKLPILEGNNRCYDDDPGECEAFGRLYSREAALNDSKCTCHNEASPSTSGTAQGVCPDGWHIPSKSEAQQLENSVNQSSNKLKSSYGWNGGNAGTNEKGASFTGTGAYRRENGIGEFKGKGDYTNVWVFDVSNPKDLDYLMVLGGGLVMFANEGESDPFFPIRCVKN